MANLIRGGAPEHRQPLLQDNPQCKGSPDRSRLFARAVPFRRDEADRVFDRAIHWRDGRTELQTIGSCTRAVRRLTGTAERRLLDLLQPAAPAVPATPATADA